MSAFPAQVLRDANGRPLLVFGKGRIYYKAVMADEAIKVVDVETLRGLTPLEYKGNPYPPRRCASYWLNHSTREVTKRARQVLRAFVARKQREEATA